MRRTDLPSAEDIKIIKQYITEAAVSGLPEVEIETPDFCFFVDFNSGYCFAAIGLNAISKYRDFRRRLHEREYFLHRRP